MSEDAVVILLMVIFAMIVHAIYTRLVVIRRLNKKIDKFTEAALARTGAPTAQVEDRSEVRELRQRLQVLERIAVEKEDSLSRQIDGLRAGER